MISADNAAIRTRFAQTFEEETMADSKTERVRYTFDAKRSGETELFIALQAIDENLSVLRRGFLAFDLAPGTSADRAKEIASILRENVVSVSYTG